jgi:hypothetical protein
MNGLQWTSYSSSLVSSGNSVTLYNRAIIFFGSRELTLIDSLPISIASGVVNQIQINTSNNIITPPISTFTLNQTNQIAIKFNGYFYASQTGNYTFTLGIVADGVNSQIQDYGILFIGLANATIVPASTFSENSNLSNKNPIIYTGTGINRFTYTATVNLTAGNFYPMLFYYNKGSDSFSIGSIDGSDSVSIESINIGNINTIFKCGLYFSYAGGSPITDYTSYIYNIIPIVNGITYNIIDNTQTVKVVASKGSPYTNTIIIPNSVTMSNGLVYTVVSIGDSAFSGCSKITIDISSCTSITSIQASSFNGCISFAIILPSSVTNIGDYTFSDSGLTAITLTSSIKTIGANAFKNCGLTTINLPSSLTNIGANAFENCGLTNIALPSSLISIGDNAFYRCASLTTVTLVST